MSTSPAPLDDSASGPIPLCWVSTAATHVGHVRKINEDAFLDAREQGLWVVADGMGGHSRGDRASQSIIEQLHDFAAPDDTDEALEALLERLEAANRLCRDVEANSVMGSTVALLQACGDKGLLVWAGDSRVYRLRTGTVEQLTEDHSLVQELHRLGELTAEEAEKHPSSNVITRAIGVNETLDVQITRTGLQPGDRFLLCSDGLFKGLANTELVERLELPAPQQALDALMDLALKRGGTDNITAIVVQVARP